MKWNNTRLDKLPTDKQEVLLSYKGVNYIASYDAGHKCFTVTSKSRVKKFNADEDQLYWKEYRKPGNK